MTRSAVGTWKWWGLLSLHCFFFFFALWEHVERPQADTGLHHVRWSQPSWAQFSLWSSLLSSSLWKKTLRQSTWLNHRGTRLWYHFLDVQMPQWWTKLKRRRRHWMDFPQYVVDLHHFWPTSREVLVITQIPAAWLICLIFALLFIRARYKSWCCHWLAASRRQQDLCGHCKTISP